MRTAELTNAPMASPSGLDPVFLAMQRFKRQRYEECIDMCTELLMSNPYDQAVWCGQALLPPG